MHVGIFIKNSQQSLLDPDHLVLNQRNLMKRFKRVQKYPFCDQKMPIYPTLSIKCITDERAEMNRYECPFRAGGLKRKKN